jgi:hypothetical protein
MALNLPTMADVAAARIGKPIPKGPSRLQETIADTPLVLVDLKAFRAEVFARDGFICRWCLRVVVACVKRQPNRREIHHVHGRGKELRFEARAALVLCAECHEKVTGRVNERWIILPTETFVMHEQEYTDARRPVNFQRVA